MVLISELKMLGRILLLGLVLWPWPVVGLQLPQKPEFRASKPAPMLQDGLGIGVAIEGDSLLTGQLKSGPVVVFERDQATNTWLFVQELPYPDPTSLLDGYGQNIVVQGDIAIVSAGGHYPAGIVYVYERSATSGLWSLKQRLEPPVLRVGDFFGVDVRLTGGVLAIGAWKGGPLTPGGGDADGAVYIYIQDAGTGLFDLHQKLVAPVQTAGAPTGVDHFGENIAMTSPDRVLIAADGTPRDGVRKGVCYVYEPDAGNVWQHVATLEVNEPEVEDVGSRVALYGDAAAVVATVTGGPSLLARIVLYRRDSSSGAWSRISDINDPDRGSFGRDLVLMSEDQLVTANLEGNSTDGAIEVYERNPVDDSWAIAGTLTAPYEAREFDENTASFGGFFDVDGDVVAVGAQGAIVEGKRAGAVWIFTPDAPEIDARLELDVPNSNLLQTGRTFTVTFAANNSSATDSATHPIVTLPLDNDLTVVSMSPGCAVSTVRDGSHQRVTCESQVLTPGATWQPEIGLRTSVAGLYTFGAEHFADQIDPDRSNNQAATVVEVRAAPPGPASASGGGLVTLATFVLLTLGAAGRRAAKAAKLHSSTARALRNQAERD